MNNIFDGKAKAWEIEQKVAEKIKKTGETPKLVSIVVGDEENAIMYQRMKRKAADKVGAELSITTLDEGIGKDTIKELILKLNNDKKFDGIMLQLPLPANFSLGDRDEIINCILPQKDVDGMRDDSFYVAPVVKAIITALNESRHVNSTISKTDIAKELTLIGANGFVGRKAVRFLEKEGYEVVGVDVDLQEFDNFDLKFFTKRANILICAANKPNIISKDMIRKGAIVIDVGAPVGNLQKDAYEKCSFVTPVPGGIGPVTIACLMENLLTACLKCR